MRVTLCATRRDCVPPHRIATRRDCVPPYRIATRHSRAPPYHRHAVADRVPTGIFPLIKAQNLRPDAAFGKKQHKDIVSFD